MPKIITIAHQKGGVGKSTLALNIALALADRADVAIADLDPQGTISMLRGNAAVPVAIIDNGVKLQDLSKLPCDVLVVDTPPYNNNNIMALFSMSDVVVVPTRPGIPDVMAIATTIGYFRDAQKNNADLRGGIVINMVKPRGGLLDSVKRQLAEYEMPVLAEIGDRVSFTRSIMTGGVTAGTDVSAQNELNTLINGILKLLSNG